MPNSASAMSVLLNRSGIRRSLFGVVYCGLHALSVSIVVSICDSCWKDDRDTCGTCVKNIIEEDRVYAEEEEQQVVDLLGDEESISGNFGSILVEYNTAMGSPDLDNSLIALEATINGGSGIVDRDDSVYDVQLTNRNSSSTINTVDNIRVCRI